MEVRMRLVWFGANDEIFYAWGRCIDISTNGMKVELDSYTIAGAEMRSVSFSFAGPERFDGSATARHRTQRGMKTVIGLEFTGGLEWHPDMGAASELSRLARGLRENAAEPVPVS